MGVRCFMVRPTHRWRLSMRRYGRGDGNCTANRGYGYHNADSAVLEVMECKPDPDGIYRGLPEDDHWPRADPRWPVKCDHCAYQFSEADSWQCFAVQIYVDDAGVEYGSRNLPPGAMRLEDDEPEYLRGPDGRTLHVICPDGHDWSPDHPCNNCTLPNDRGPYGTAHRCWTRTGVPPLVQVGKQFGKSCSAGGGSILTPGYHGFLGTNGAAPGFFS